MCAGQPLEADAIGLAQQQLCLQKFEILHQAWSESTRLGQTVRVPYLANHLTVQRLPRLSHAAVAACCFATFIMLHSYEEVRAVRCYMLAWKLLSLVATRALRGSASWAPWQQGWHARAQLHVSLILSVVAATTLRALEVLLSALFPGMPRYAIVRQLARFIAGAP